MSETFYTKFLNFFSYFIILSILGFGSLESFTLYLVTQQLLFYYSYITIVAIFLFFGIKYYLAFNHFKENLHLYVPNSDVNQALISIPEDEDQAIR